MAKKESKKARKKRLAAEAKGNIPIKKKASTAPKKTKKSNFDRIGIQQLLPLALILVLTFLAFSPSLKNEFVNWDDDKNFAENENITSLNKKNFWDNTKKIFTSPVIGNYNPLSIWTFLIEQKFFGLEKPMYWHLDNILLHLICVFFVYLIGSRLGLGKFGTILFTLLFAIHPLRVESVTWVTERKDVLFGAFFLASLYYYILSAKFGSRLKWTVIIWVCFILSLLSKIQAVTLPICFILVDYYLSGKLDFKSMLRKAPYFLASLATGLIGIYFLKNQGSLETVDNYGGISRLFIGSWSLIVYYVKSLIPYEMSPLYPYPTSMPVYFYPSILSFFGTAAYLWYAYKKEWRVGFFGIGFFIANIFFLLQILGAGQGFIADRFSYIAYIGLAFIMAYYAEKLTIEKPNLKYAIYGLSAVVVLAFTGMTYQQTKIWKNSGTLWTHTLKYYNKITLPFGNRANYYRDKGMVSEALADYSQTIRLKPNEAGPYNSRARLYFNFSNRDSLQKALFNYNKAIELKPDEDEYYINRGATYAKLGNIDQALVNFNKGIELDPTFGNGYLNRSVVYNQRGDYPNALKDIETYLKLKPYSPDLWYECARLRNVLNNPQGAYQAINTAIGYSNNNGLYYFEKARTEMVLGQSAASKQSLQYSQQLGYKGDTNITNQIKMQQ